MAVQLARRDLESKTSERYKGFVVRSRLKRVLNEAVKSNVTAREEEVRRFPGRYIDSVKMDACCDRITRCVMPFGGTFEISLPAVLTSRFRSFAAILPTSPASERPKWLVVRL